MTSPFPDNGKAKANANATTNYTPRERAVIAETLRRALPIIWDGTGDEYAEGRIDREEYICHAAQRASSPGADDRELVPNLIRKRMDDPMMEWPPASLETWLCRVLDRDHGVYEESLHRDQQEELQEYRRAWVRSLIEEFEL